jgi:beta-lactamase class A
MTRLACGLAVVLVGALRTAGADPSSLEDCIAPIAKGHKGKIAVAVKNLHTGEAFHLNADEPMPTASLIKLPVMVEAYWQAEEGKVKLDTMLTLKKDPRVKGSGVLAYHFSDGASFPLRDAVRLMIVYSDNMATNMVLDQIGIAATGERMSKLGLNETRINAKVFRADTRIDQERGKKYGLGSTTAGEMVRLLEMIQAGKVVTPDACQEMLDHLKACDDKEKMTRFLPPGTAVAHKTGSVNASKTDAGIIYVPDPADKKKTVPVALCVMTDENEDRRWVADNAAQVTIGKIARSVYDHFAGKR